MNRLSRYAALICLAAAATLPAQAASDKPSASRAQVNIGAVVKVSFRLGQLLNPSQLVVTSQDIARGFIDLHQASSFQLATNTRNNFSVAVAFDPSLISGVALRMLENEFTARSPGASGLVQTTHAGSQHVMVSYRVLLNGEARPGNYAWPIGLSFSALT